MTLKNDFLDLYGYDVVDVYDKHSFNLLVSKTINNSYLIKYFHNENFQSLVVLDLRGYVCYLRLKYINDDLSIKNNRFISDKQYTILNDFISNIKSKIILRNKLIDNLDIKEDKKRINKI